ncbi:serine hydrolase domain-containing protein [Rathayibacter tanaceti]|uniref:D-alanyl-D-alanine-carboxypeptidase/endopeptidase AmpH n=2 Tax=Rathayibacter tanaceti TaxID=1671680 RepID=A0A166HZ44_9MICO|nr:serine hydrolase domain-containing protein [Rathayibacter tanaceti]KZX21375.1 D-alanyl-D-alanine-carboxypeptidase/endopeptidase AmpH precursor [Rathayibacter tanaceti]QHC54375.1 serine hydrolase [Rathayibacter tanaceti]TCO38058.1 CubicO group peptidase (beta-lactamase class C family) [Rathayibacter tanaceti]
MTRRRLALAATAAAVVLIGGVLLRPSAPTLSPDATGDAEIAQWLRTDVGDGARHHLVAAVVTPEGIRYGGLGADERTEVEIGSVTKTMTALLLAQSAAAGTVALDDRAADYAEVGDFPGTLAQLASHRSGLPRIPTGVGEIASTVLAQLRGTDPYAGWSAADTLRHAAEADLGAEEVAYSNLGAAVLGQTLARAEGRDYADLLRERVLDPLGMTDSSVPVTADALAPDAPTGYTASGRSVAPWTLAGYAPAGGVRSTAADMARYAQALLTDDPALGVAGSTVLEPRFDAGDGNRIGLSWYTSDAAGGGSTTWHNGGTAGYSTMLVMDRDRGVAVFVNGDTASSVDELGVTLLQRVLEEES